MSHNKYKYTNSFILNALNLPLIKDLESASYYLGVSQKLIYLLSKHTENYYKEFLIPKKNGSVRVIHSPTYSLKLVQRWILKEILEKINVSDEAMAFRKGNDSGIKRNAEFHRYSLFLLQLDIKDFFTSIKKERVFYLFKDFGYSAFVSNILASLCTYKGYLPQGGVCSPYISNLICFKFDKRLKGLCSKRDILYTRYADDLTLSCDNKDYLKKIRKVVEDIIVDEGFEVNKNKTRFLSPGSHKHITGITVNDNKLKANKVMKKKVRAMIHNAIVSCDYSKNNQIRGYISHINSVEEGYKNKIIKYINTMAEKDYKHHLDIVTAFNNNKIFKELNSLTFEEIHPYSIEDEYFMDEMMFERSDFLRNRGLISDREVAASKEDDK